MDVNLALLIKRMVHLALLQRKSSLPSWQDELKIFRSYGTKLCVLPKTTCNAIQFDLDKWGKALT